MPSHRGSAISNFKVGTHKWPLFQEDLDHPRVGGFPVSYSLSAFAVDCLCSSRQGVSDDLEGAIYAFCFRKVRLICSRKALLNILEFSPHSLGEYA